MDHRRYGSSGALSLCGIALLACQQWQRRNQMTLLNIVVLFAVIVAFVMFFRR